MTYAQALNFAIDSISDDIVRERLTALRDTLAKRAERSQDSKDKANAKRKEKNAQVRGALMAQVLPILRDHLAEDITAKELFAACANELPQDFTSAKVQYILLHELADEVVKTEAKGKPNTYRLV